MFVRQFMSLTHLGGWLPQRLVWFGALQTAGLNSKNHTTRLNSPRSRVRSCLEPSFEKLVRSYFRYLTIAIFLRTIGTHTKDTLQGAIAAASPEPQLSYCHSRDKQLQVMIQAYKYAPFPRFKGGMLTYVLYMSFWLWIKLFCCRQFWDIRRYFCRPFVTCKLHLFQ